MRIVCTCQFKVRGETLEWQTKAKEMRYRLPEHGEGIAGPDLSLAQAKQFPATKRFAGKKHARSANASEDGGCEGWRDECVPRDILSLNFHQKQEQAS